MIDSLRFRPEVVDDLEDAANWYDDRNVGLGAEFLQECYSTLNRILDHPQHFAEDADGLRSARLHRFPYVVHFRIEGQTIVVFAILFGGRDPSIWQDRL